MYYRIVFLWILIFILLIFRFYLLIKSHNNTVSSTQPPVTVYVCPQIPSSSSKGYFHVDFTYNLPVNYSKICEKNDILLVYILSKVDHIERRKAIRRTWANRDDYDQLTNTCFVFIIGLTNNQTLKSEIYSEVLMYEDMVQVNLTDTYQNIVYKEVGGLKWSHIYASHIPFLFKTDDDIIVDSILLSDITIFFRTNQTQHSKYLQKQDKIKEFVNQTSIVNKYTLFKGLFVNGHKMKKRGKFGLTNLAWNYEDLQGYCRGSGYMFSSFIRNRLYRASLCFAVEYAPWAGDVFVSGSLANAAAVHCSSWPIEYSQSHDGCSFRFQNHSHLLVCSTPMHIGRLYMADYDQSWTAILDRHSITNETNQQAKNRRLALLVDEIRYKTIVEQSIINQVTNEFTSKDAPIVPLKQMTDKLDK